MERTSTSRLTATCWSRVKNSPIGRVEWPIMKTVDLFLDCRARFVIIIYNKDDDIRPAASVIHTGQSGSGYVKSKMVNHCWRSRGPPGVFAMKYAIIENATPHRVAQSRQWVSRPENGLLGRQDRSSGLPHG